MMMSAITEMQAVELIRDYMRNIEEFRVVFAFKRMKLKPIRNTTVELMRACIAIHDFGLPITTKLTATICGAVQENMVSRLHTLGDRKCLLLKRSDVVRPGHALEWTIDPLFLGNYK